jgi:Fur family transcriptional regulator, peroxide stress response regulator
METISKIREKLIKSGLKVTPQRIVVLEALIKLNNHPTAEKIIEYIKTNHPNIAIGTVYKTLETFTEKGLIKKVNTENGIMRYDAMVERHHHIHYTDSDKIEDYFNDEINILISEYFKKHEIHDFEIEDIKLQIIGRFIKTKK